MWCLPGCWRAFPTRHHFIGPRSSSFGWSTTWCAHSALWPVRFAATMLGCCEARGCSETQGLKLCSGCRGAKYCSSVCQSVAWKDHHKVVCKENREFWLRNIKCAYCNSEHPPKTCCGSKRVPPEQHFGRLELVSWGHKDCGWGGCSLDESEDLRRDFYVKCGGSYVKLFQQFDGHAVGRALAWSLAAIITGHPRKALLASATFASLAKSCQKGCAKSR